MAKRQIWDLPANALPYVKGAKAGGPL